MVHDLTAVTTLGGAGNNWAKGEGLGRPLFIVSEPHVVGDAHRHALCFKFYDSMRSLH